MADQALIQAIKRVQTRLWINRMIHMAVFSLYIAAGIFFIVFVLSRLLGIIPPIFGLFSIGWLAAAALAGGLIGGRRSTPDMAARLIDEKLDSHDLVFTALQLENAAGSFQPLVEKAADEIGPKISAAQVSPINWVSYLKPILIIFLTAGLLVQFLPQFDPFGRQKLRDADKEWEERLNATRRATQARAVTLNKRDIKARNSKPVNTGLNNLKQTFRQMKPGDRVGNLKRLGQNQKQLGELWREVQKEKLGQARNTTESQQRFGKLNSEQAKEWKSGMQKGDGSAMQKSVNSMKRTLNRLRKTQNEAERKQLQKQLQREMKQMSEFMKQEMKSDAAQAALQRAMEQMQMSDMQGLSEEAMKGLEESLNLTSQEIDDLAQAMRDMQDLEQALQALQQAKKLNDEGRLDGQACEGFEGIDDYADLYSKMMGDGKGGKGQGKGPGPGMGGEGTGEGNQAPEDPDQVNEFKTEISRSPLQAGKILMKMKTQGMGKRGEALRDYQAVVQDVKQGVSEAIIQEQVPPGYHDAIREYFHTLEEQSADEDH